MDRPGQWPDAAQVRDSSCSRCHGDRGLRPDESGAVTVIQRANSDLRLNPLLHAAFLDDVHSPDGDGKGQMFHPATAPTQQDVELVVEPGMSAHATGLSRRRERIPEDKTVEMSCPQRTQRTL